MTDRVWEEYAPVTTADLLALNALMNHCRKEDMHLWISFSTSEESWYVEISGLGHEDYVSKRSKYLNEGIDRVLTDFAARNT